MSVSEGMHFTSNKESGGGPPCNPMPSGSLKSRYDDHPPLSWSKVGGRLPFLHLGSPKSKVFCAPLGLKSVDRRYRPLQQTTFR